MQRRVSLVVSIAGLLMLGVPAAAQAGGVATYADEDRPSDAGNCDTPATACKTILGALSKTGTGGTVFVDGGSYSETNVIEPTANRSLIYQEINTSDGPAIVDGGIGLPAIQVNDGTTAGTIQGLTLRGDLGALYAFGSVTITGNTFDDDANTGSGPVGSLQLGGGTTDNFVVTSNTFTDPAVTDDQFGIDASMGGSSTATMSGNMINGFLRGIQVVGGSTGTQQISGNTITGTHEFVGLPTDLPGIGIWIEGGAASLTANRVQQPGSSALGNIGITVFPGAFGTVNTTFARNQIYNMNYSGVDLSDTSSATFNGDVIANNATGLSSVDNSNGGVDADARNVTVWGNVTDISIFDSDLNLASSIVGNAISAGSAGGGDSPSCSITFSRGPTMTAGGDGCQDFQTTAAPAFADPTSGINNFHLMAGSPMIDMGSTIAPPPGTLDLDGDQRVLAGVCNGTPRADIGADEFVPNCTPPPTFTPPPAITPTPTAPSGAKVTKKKKCKKKRANAKKCRRKK